MDGPGTYFCFSKYQNRQLECGSLFLKYLVYVLCSQVPKEAYFAKCDNKTTTQNDIEKGVVSIVVGFAPLKPAEVQQQTGKRKMEMN
jgi:hypothetical protein